MYQRQFTFGPRRSQWAPVSRRAVTVALWMASARPLAAVACLLRGGIVCTPLARYRFVPPVGR